MQNQFVKKVTAFHKGGTHKRFAPLFLLISLLITVTLLRPAECLTGESYGRLLFAMPIREGDTFEISFIHSLNLSPVTDEFEFFGEEMILRKSVFKTFGAGIPVPSDGIGTELIFVDGHYELLGIDKPMSAFSIMTQSVPDHYISFKGRKISLLNLVGSGKVVEISVKRVSRLRSLLCRLNPA